MIFYARYIATSLIFLFFLFYCNFWLNLESFYPVTFFFYLMSNKGIYKRHLYLLYINQIAN